MNHQEALKILRLQDGDLNEQSINKAYQRLIRRYPPESFPQKFGSVKAAYDALTSPAKKIENIFRNDEIDARWLGSYLKTKDCDADNDRAEFMREFFFGDFDLGKYPF